MPESTDQPQQLINGELKPLSGMEATSTIPVLRSKAEYLKAVMYEGVRLPIPTSPPTFPQASDPRSPPPWHHCPPPPPPSLPSPPLPNPPPQVTILEGTATWCAQCKAIAPEIAKLAHEYPGVKFFLYDVEECEDLAHELGVTSMPSFSVFRDGEIQEGVTGARLGAVRKAIEACL